MACCKAHLSHGSDSCSIAFADKTQSESGDGQKGEHASHRSASEKSSQTVSLASPIITAPCSPQCAAAASASIQLRRPRASAATSITGNPHLPTLVTFKKEFPNLRLPSSETRRRIRPRAPPASLSSTF
jgi:hypothetical protein